MVVQILASAVYEAIRHSWLVATVLVKYILVGHLGALIYRNDISFRSFLELVEKYSRETVVGIIGLGIVFSAIGFRPESMLTLSSEMIALAYFGYLFWEY